MLRTLKINAVTNEIHFRNRIYKTSIRPSVRARPSAQPNFWGSIICMDTTVVAEVPNLTWLHICF